MKSALMAVAIAGLSFAGIARAEIVYPSALVFEPGFASGPPPGFPMQQSVFPEPGDPLRFMAKVAAVNAPFADLLPAGAYEVTCVIQGATCEVTGTYGPAPCFNFTFGYFVGGTVSVYLDTTPDADFTSVATFADGELVLLGTISGVTIMDADPPADVCPWANVDLFVGFDFVGGSWFYRVGSAFFHGLLSGEIDGQVPPELQALGFTFRAGGHVDVEQSLPTRPTSWGRVKALYR